MHCRSVTISTYIHIYHIHTCYIIISISIIYSSQCRSYFIHGVGECVTGDVRLVGETEAEGKVEICIYGWWSTVCGKYWTNNNTAVLCRHLGFSDIISGW